MVFGMQLGGEMGRRQAATHLQDTGCCHGAQLEWDEQ